MSFSSLQGLASEAGDAISDAVSSADGPEAVGEEELDRIASEIASKNRTGLKHQLTNLDPSPRSSADAYLSLWRRFSVDEGSKTRIEEERVTIEDRPLREHRFLVTNTDYQKAERFMVRSTFGDGPEIAHSFGEQPLMWRFSGVLRRGNRPATLQDHANNWWQALESFYMNRLRATLLMRQNEFIVLRVGKLKMRGYITQFNTRAAEQRDDAAAQFSFSMYVRSYNFVGGYEHQPSSEKLAADRPVLRDEAEEAPSTDPMPGTVA